MPGTPTARAPRTATPTSTGRGRIAQSDRRASVIRAPRTATPASTAHSVSATSGLSAVSIPETKLIPEVLAITQPPSAAPLTATPERLTHQLERTRASAPQASWTAAVMAKTVETVRSSPCEPTAVAWMAPATSEARAATRSAPGAEAVAVAVESVESVSGAAVAGLECAPGRGGSSQKRSLAPYAVTFSPQRVDGGRGQFTRREEELERESRLAEHTSRGSRDAWPTSSNPAGRFTQSAGRHLADEPVTGHLGRGATSA